MVNNSRNNNPQGNNQYSQQGNSQSGNQGNNQSSKQGNSQSGKQGFASMDPERQREIASEGGRASHGSQQSNLNQGSQQSGRKQDKQGGGVQGGTPEQHAEAGRQSHKNR